jgi:hypothetical protein
VYRDRDGVARADEAQARMPQQLALQAQMLLDSVGKSADVAVPTRAGGIVLHGSRLLHSSCHHPAGQSWDYRARCNDAVGCCTVRMPSVGTHPHSPAAIVQVPMFITTDSVAFFDYLRVPYEVAPAMVRRSPSGFAGFEARTGAGALWWPAADALEQAAVPKGGWRWCDATGFARLVDDDSMQARLGTGWQPREMLTTGDGQTRVALWANGSGAMAIPFDPGELLHAFWSEAYLDALPSNGSSRIVRGYYAIKPLLARPIQIALRRAFARLQGGGAFPAWPLETSLHDLMGRLYLLASEAAQEPPPWIAPWPAPHEWALVLTHDVETAAGLAGIEDLRDVEREFGLRSSWNFVPCRYPLDGAVVRELQEAECEVGVHGLRHDGSDLASEAVLRERLPEMHAYAERWGAVGFRSPSTLRGWDLVAMLGFDYDSSYPDTDPYEPQPGGSCSWLPYAIGDVIELPITLPQDFTLFTVLAHTDARVWLDKANAIRQRGGMVLVLTHPDYQRTAASRELYRTLLRANATDRTAWHALPREVSRWWRMRAASELRPDGLGGTWRIHGPAAENGSIVTREVN